jgi:hypothetical protein
MSRPLAILLIFSLLTLSGCAALRPPPPSTPEAEAALAAVAAFNAEVRTFKGTGTIELVRDGTRQVGRMVWVGKVPAHLRVSLLDPVGRPLSTLVADGDRVAGRAGPAAAAFSAPAANPSLKRVLGIPLRAREAIRLLAGQVPTPRPHSVTLAGDRLRLHSRWNQLLEVVELDPTHARPVALERFSGGERRFRAELGPLKSGPEEVRIPTRIAVAGPDGTARFDLRVDRFWVNQSLPAGAFVLEPPE